jgi:hypothetical protein
MPPSGLCPRVPPSASMAGKNEVISGLRQARLSVLVGARSSLSTNAGSVVSSLSCNSASHCKAHAIVERTLPARGAAGNVAVTKFDRRGRVGYAWFALTFQPRLFVDSPAAKSSIYPPARSAEVAETVEGPEADTLSLAGGDERDDLGSAPSLLDCSRDNPVIAVADRRLCRFQVVLQVGLPPNAKLKLC